MSSSALAALLGKKPASTPTPSAPSAIPTPASVPAATLVAPPAAQTTPPPPATPAPAPAAAPSAASLPAVTPGAAPAASASAQAPRPEPGLNAVPAGAAGVAPPDALAALLGDFTAAAGKAPRVNPPQAAAVLAGPTAKEVAGHPEPAEVVEEKIAPVQKPADVLAAEQAPKSRRTAAVVQVELDAANLRIAELENALVAAVEKAAGVLQVAQEGDADLAAEAVELIEQLRSEAAVSLEDNRKAWARVAVLEEQLEKVTAGALRADAFKGEGPVINEIIDASNLDFGSLVTELQSRLGLGQAFTITGLS